jgi:hypothetical protein
MLRFCVIGLLLLSCYQLLNAQSLNGLWYGRAEANTVGAVNSYLCEITLKKNSKGFSGVLNYYFGSNEFNVPITAKYWPATKTIELNPFPLITYFASDKNAPDCIMDGSLTLYVDDADSVLYGQLNPVGKYRNSCPIMTVHLRREGASVKTYEEPIKPEEEVREVAEVLSEEKTLILSESERKSVDSLSSEIIPTPKENEIKLSVEALTGRNFITGPLIEVETDTIQLFLYDNGRVDNDTISVFLNRRPVVLNQGLSVKPIVLKLKLEPGDNEVALFAVNVGDIPPNTALCIIYAGDKRYDINLSSTLLSNGTIRVRKKEHLP